jgi:hypothetical protein
VRTGDVAEGNSTSPAGITVTGQTLEQTDQQVLYTVEETVFLRKFKIGVVEMSESSFTIRVGASIFAISSVQKKIVVLAFEANDENAPRLVRWITEHFKIGDFAQSLNTVSPIKVVFKGFDTRLGEKLKNKIVHNPTFSRIGKSFGKQYMKKALKAY